MDSCPICAEEYYNIDDAASVDTRSVADSSIRCEYTCDSGKQCKLSKSVDEDLCSLHLQQRVPIKCLHCQKDGCKICYRRFFLQQLEEPFCMHCKKPFDLEFLLGYDENKNQRFSRSFIWGPWKEHRENVLLDRVMARMPEFQPKASAQAKLIRARDLQKRVKARINQLTRARSPLFKKLAAYRDIKAADLNNFPYEDQLQELNGKVKKFDERIKRLNQRAKELKKEVENERFMVQTGRYAQNQNEIEEAKAAKAAESHVFRGKCPKDDCNGFIEDKWACGMCGDKICSKCMMPKKKDHECKDEDVETIKYFREQRNSKEGESTRPCPACRTLVWRNGGCNQMWCITCHTFFDWAKGTIIKDKRFVHNPEHDEWVRKNGGVLGDNLNFAVGVGICGLNSADIYALTSLSKREQRILAEVLRLSNEIRDELAGYTDPLERRIENTCIEFLKGKMKKSGLKALVQQHYKASKKAELANARRTMYADTVQQMLRVAIDEAKKPDAKGSEIVQRTINSVQSLREYTEKCMRTIGQIFNSSAPHLSEIQFKKERAAAVHTPKKMVNMIDAVRKFLNNDRDHQGHYFPYKHQGFYDDNREAFCVLSGTHNSDRFMKFLKENPDWKPTVADCAKAIKRTQYIGYKNRYKARRWLNNDVVAELSVKRFQMLTDQERESLQGKCIWVRENFEDDLMESKRFCRIMSPNVAFCKSCRTKWGVPSNITALTFEEAKTIKFDDDDSESEDEDWEEPVHDPQEQYERELAVAMQASLTIA